jgi:hypothetical protein
MGLATILGKEERLLAVNRMKGSTATPVLYYTEKQDKMSDSTVND